jgi:hypothetical protein
VTPRRSVPPAVKWTLLVVSLWGAACARQPQPPADGATAGESSRAVQFRAFVSQGKPDAFDRYYKEVVTKDTGFVTDTKPTLDELLAYFGYTSPTAEQLESGEPADLMRPYTDDELLVSRFFAPKISDVSKAVAREFGWRKLVRLRATPESRAKAAGLQNMFLLFNVFTKKEVGSPFSGGTEPVTHSVNNQVILVRESGNLTLRPLYFMTFGSFGSGKPEERGRLINYLDATFDAANAPPNDEELPPGVTRYYVPVACEACHGGESRPKLNYLDTDHWLDRTGDDFYKVRQPVIYDGGVNDPVAFGKAFGVIRKLNAEILAQNRDADGSLVTFQQAAARSWLKRHDGVDSHRPMHLRTVAPNGASTTWSENETELLRLLNRYCFRCHSTIRYHVYDKAAVLDRRLKMAALVESGAMPDDRELPPNVKATLKDLLETGLRP